MNFKKYLNIMILIYITFIFYEYFFTLELIE